MASTGHASIQAPQSMQESASTTALPPAMLMALLGHSSTQDSQPVHFALSTSAGMHLPFQIGAMNLLRKHGIIPHCSSDYKRKSPPKNRPRMGWRSRNALRRFAGSGRDLIYGTTLRGRGGFLPQAPPWVPVERCAVGRRLSDQWDGAGSPGDHPDPSEIRGLRDSRTAAAIALTRSLGSDWAIQSRTLSNSSP